MDSVEWMPSKGYRLGKSYKVLSLMTMRQAESFSSEEVAKLEPSSVLEVLKHGTGPSGRRLKVRVVVGLVGLVGWVSCWTSGGDPLLSQRLSCKLYKELISSTVTLRWNKMKGKLRNFDTQIRSSLKRHQNWPTPWDRDEDEDEVEDQSEDEDKDEEEDDENDDGDDANDLDVDEDEDEDTAYQAVLDSGFREEEITELMQMTVEMCDTKPVSPVVTLCDASRGIRSKTNPKNQTQEVLECSICLSVITFGEPLRHLPCKHFFHTACVDTWLQNKVGSGLRGCCPLCRRETPMEDTLLSRAEKVVAIVA